MRLSQLYLVPKGNWESNASYGWKPLVEDVGLAPGEALARREEKIAARRGCPHNEYRVETLTHAQRYVYSAVSASERPSGPTHPPPPLRQRAQMPTRLLLCRIGRSLVNHRYTNLTKGGR
jgi:hypothetical protein